MGVYMDFIDVAAEAGDWAVASGPSSIAGYSASAESPVFGTVRVVGAPSDEAAAQVLAQAIAERAPGLCGCLGAGVHPSENGPYLTACEGCREPSEFDFHPGDAVVRDLANRSLK